MEDLDVAYMRMAYRIAEKSSTDPSTQNGAVLVLDDMTSPIVAANHFPRGVKETEERWQRPLKYSYVEHAERQSIYVAAKRGFQTDGCTMYCPWVCCSDCARAIIQAGIIEVVGHDFELHNSRDDWKEAVRIGREMLAEAGVKLRFVTGKIGNVKIRFGGTIVEP